MSATIKTRFNAVTDEDTVLQFQFLKNGIEFSAFSIDRVEIYDNSVDAQAQTNPIEIINSPQIVESTSGLYTYTATAVSTTGVYFDTIFLVPENGLPETFYINQFNVQAYSSGTPVVLADKTLIVGNIIHPNGEPDSNTRIIIYPESISEVSSENFLVTQKQIKVKPNALGQWSVNLFPSSTIGGVEYIFHIKGRHIDVKKTISVPTLTPPDTQVEFDDLF